MCLLEVKRSMTHVKSWKTSPNISPVVNYIVVKHLILPFDPVLF